MKGTPAVGSFETFERSNRSSRSREESLTVQVVRDHWGFTLLRPHWNELLRASAADNPFLTWEWLHTWWTQLGDPGALHLVVVRAGGEPVAIAPLRLVSGGFGCFSRLEFLGTGFAGSDYLDVIVREGHEAGALAALSGYVASTRLAVRLEHVRPDSVAAALAERLAGAGWIANATPDGTCPVIPLDGHTWDSYLATLGSSHRANVRRRLRALDQAFDVRFERVGTDPERRQMLQLLAQYSLARWKDQGGSTAFLDASLLAFHDEATRRAFGRGSLRMYVLRLNGKPAAVMYGFLYGGRFYFYQHGFDPALREHSVGLVLMAMTIRAAIDEGAREFDMLWGTEAYKSLWAREARALQRIELFPVHLGGVIHRHAMDAQRRVRSLARRVLSLGAHLWS